MFFIIDQETPNVAKDESSILREYESCCQNNINTSTGTRINSPKGNLAQEILKRKNLEFEFHQESKAKAASEKAERKRRLSVGELDRKKRRGKAKYDGETKRRESDGYYQYHSEMTQGKTQGMVGKARGNTYQDEVSDSYRNMNGCDVNSKEKV